MDTNQMTYGFRRRVDLPFPAAVERTREALRSEGFGVLYEVDIRKTMQEKLSVDFRPYLILGACNPPLAHQALSAELDLGLLLPCNVVVYAEDDGAVVAAMDPVAVLGIVENPRLNPVAEKVRARLQQVIARVTGEVS